MRRQRPAALAAPVLIARALTARALAAVLLTPLLLAGCGGSAAPPPFAPGVGGSSGSGNGASPGPSASGLPDPVIAAAPLTRPPFGANVQVRYRAAEAHEPALAAALTADGDFELAYLYAQYTGGRDGRWTVYASPKAVSTFRADLARPSVTRHSFRGRVRYFAIRAYPDPATHGAVDVTGCFDDAGAVTTSVRTGQPDGPAVPANQHYFRYTDIVARRGGHWVVIGNYPALYYPQAKECKP
jgi:hypothetical protein